MIFYILENLKHARNILKCKRNAISYFFLHIDTHYRELLFRQKVIIIVHIGTAQQNSVHFDLSKSRQYGSALDLREKSAKGREIRKNIDNKADKRRQRYHSSNEASYHMNSSQMREANSWQSPPQENEYCLSTSASNIRRDQSPLRPKVRMYTYTIDEIFPLT